MKILFAVFLFSVQLAAGFPRPQAESMNTTQADTSIFFDETVARDCGCEETAGRGVQRAWLKNFAARKSQSDDEATALARDASGNVYVTGKIRGANARFDYATIKYNGAGVEQWVAHYNGPSDGDDQANAIAVDARGNVYVVGTSAGANGSYEYATIKYDAAGVEQWVARYPGSGGSSFYAGLNDIVITPAGHIIVTGYRGTVKYDQQGHTRWSTNISGKRLAVDRANNVYVLETGVTKYTPFGKKLWSTAYTGQPEAFALDDSGNVYITGYHRFNPNPRASDDVDYHTVKYDAFGKQAWAVRYDGPMTVDADFAYDVRVDKAGSVYVTGSAGTLKYSVGGAQVWFISQSASMLALDGAGNIYLLRKWRESGVAKYDASGQQLWRDDVSSEWLNDLFVDQAGNVHVAGYGPIVGGTSDFMTFTYNSIGARKWVARYNGPHRFSNVIGVALAADHAGNVYVTGYHGNAKERTDIVIFKYDASGTRLWLTRYRSSEASNQYPAVIALDDSSNVYVAGNCYPDNGRSQTAVIIKHDSHGRKKWAAHFLTPNTQGDNLKAMVVTKSGDVHIAGYTMMTRYQDLNYFTAKYDALGNQKWVAHYDAAGKEDFANALAVDSRTGDVYVTGSSIGPSYRTDAVTIKYDANGAQRWLARYNRTYDTWDRGDDIALDARGNVYVIGPGGDEYTLIKYDHNGKLKWSVYHYDIRSRFYHAATDLVVDEGGNAYVTGYGHDRETSHDIIYKTVKYGPAGAKQWRAEFPTAYKDFSRSAKLALDQARNVYVTGFNSCSPSTNFDMVTVKYNSTGGQEWKACYRGAPDVSLSTNAMAVAPAGDVYVMGSRYDYSQNLGTITTIKYSQTAGLARISEEVQSHAPRYALTQNYPNPFNPSTTIRYSLARAGHVSLKVFNLAGQEVANLVDENQSEGEHALQWHAGELASGVYVYSLRSGSFEERKKLLLVK